MDCIALEVENFIPVLESFPRDGGHWRIDWLGDVFYQRHLRYKQPFIRVALSKVSQDPSGVWNFPVPFPGNPWQIERAVPASSLNILGIGSIWKDGALEAEPDYCAESISFSIPKNDTRLIKAGVNDDGQGFILPFNLHPHHKFHTHSYCVQVCLSGGKSVVIPALELFRFYFGSSSSLISKLFHPPFEKSRLWIKAEIDKFGKVDIDLAQGISGSSAPDIARIAFNANALNAARLFTNSMLTSSKPENRMYPKMLFPFTGKTNLLVKGIWLEENFLVFRILSCNHPFPFHSLRYTMARRKSTIKNTSQDGVSSKTSGLGRMGKPDPIKGPLTNEAPDRTLATKLKRTSSHVRFPDLENKYVTRIDPEVAIRLLQNASGKTTKLSVGDGESKSGIRSIDLVSVDDVKTPKGPDITGEDNHVRLV